MAEHGVRTPDGRVLSVLTRGAEDRPPLVFHAGTPCGAVILPTLAESCEAVGVRLVAYSRPGYGGSGSQPGRSVASAADDVRVILDYLGATRFVAVGFSGGGPHALACAARTPGCLAVATVGGVAPYGVPGLDWFAGMAADNVEEFGLAVSGEAELAPYLAKQRAERTEVTAEQIVDDLAGLLPEVDRMALADWALGDWLAASMRTALLTGIDGWLHDDVAFVRPWGFDVRDIPVPVAVWHGEEDLMVPPTHGRWLAEHLPRAEPHVLSGHGHMSLTDLLPEIVAGVVRLAT